MKHLKDGQPEKLFGTTPKPVNGFVVGKLSRNELEEGSPVRPQRVLQVFERLGRVLELNVGGQVLGTTAEHPFWVDGQGWVAAGELQVGDVLVTHTGELLKVEGLRDTDDVQTVYNLEVEEDHTYFVGCAEWRFSVWAHNANCAERLTSVEKDNVRQLTSQGIPVRNAIRQVKAARTATEVEALYSNSKDPGKVYYDRNGKTSKLRGEDFGLMAGGNLHAETGAMAKSVTTGLRGGNGTLIVDTRAYSKDAICGWCKTDIKRMAVAQELDHLTVVHINRNGETVYQFPRSGLQTVDNGGLTWSQARQ